MENKNDETKEPEVKAEIKEDAWGNVIAGFNQAGKDKTVGNNFESPDLQFFNDKTLTDIYVSEGLGATIIKRPADDMTREWITIKNDTDGKIQEELKRLKSHNAINTAIKWARLYRGAVVVMFFEGDKTDLEKPAPATIKGIRSLRTYSAARIDFMPTDINEKYDSEYYDELEVFPIRKRNGTVMRVHASRCLVFKGKVAPDYDSGIDLKYLYWGLPVLMGIWDRLSNYGVIEKSVAGLMQESTIGKYVFKNLLQMLAQNDNEGIKQIYNRVQIINMAKSTINAVILAEGEEYTRDSITFSGIPDIIDRMMMNLSAVCKIPVTILFGRSPAGMNATGDSDFQGYYDDIRETQKNWLYYPLKTLVDRIAMYTKVSDPQIEFNPLKEESKKDKAETRKLNTESDKIDYEMGVATPEEITKRRESRD